MHAIFWDVRRVTLFDFLEVRQTINSDSCIMILTKLKIQTFKIGPEKKENLYLATQQCQATCKSEYHGHMASIGQAVLPQPLYSPGLVISHFCLFGLMKNGLNGQHFPSNTVIIAAMKVGHLHQVLNFMSIACRLLFIASKNA